MYSKYFSQLTLQDFNVKIVSSRFDSGFCGDSVLRYNHNFQQMEYRKLIKSTGPPNVMELTTNVAAMNFAAPPPMQLTPMNFAAPPPMQELIRDNDEENDEDEDDHIPKKLKTPRYYKKILEKFLDENLVTSMTDLPIKWNHFKAYHNLTKAQIKGMRGKLSAVQEERTKLSNIEVIYNWLKQHPDAQKEFTYVFGIGDVDELISLQEKLKMLLEFVEFRILENNGKFTYGNLFDIMTNDI